ncbi:hypothetical protein COY27_01845 [Candidatus Woesearchaeota archaeon CG_4_10_14_0_2_um_filter_33_13]|nr:MAG: hypothetical protein COY27_01845 [Candidatus Woesearchaeota archaeon CG_4_10_14_0_2_um_filter_33_13]
MSTKYEIPLNILSIKDRKILMELFNNARTPFSIIGKRTGLSKEVVNYRIKRMLDNKILIRFNTVLDVNRLNWEIYLVNIKLRNINNQIEEEIIKAMVSHANIAQVLKCIGNHDLILKIFVRNYIEANSVMKELEQQFKSHIDSYTLNFVEMEQPIPLPFFYAPLKIKEQEINLQKSSDPISVSEIDLHILKLLSHHARMPTTDMAKTIGISRELVSHHLKKLEKNKVIIKYRPSAWSGSKSIGYSWYFVMLKLNQNNQSVQKRLQYYILNNPNMTYYYKTIGQQDLQFEIRLKTSDELNSILMEIRAILKDELRSHQLSIILKEFKYTYFPECLSR